MSDLLFLNLLRTSLIVGALTLILTLLSPFWDRRFSARWKKRLWYLLSLVLLAGIFFSIPGGEGPHCGRAPGANDPGGPQAERDTQGTGGHA